MSEIVVVDGATGEVVELSELERTWQELERATSVAHIATIEDKAAAFQAVAQKAKVGLNKQNDWAEVKLAAMRKGGHALDELDRNAGGRPRKTSVTMTGVSVPTIRQLLDDENASRAENRARRWRRLSGIPDDEVRTYCDRQRGEIEEITEAGLIAYYLGTDGQRITASNENEWYTPAKYIEAARTVLGGIDLDPASCAEANRTVKAERFYTARQDGLNKTWTGTVWLNPPYGRLAGDFITRLVAEHASGAVSGAVALVNAHCTDTSWFNPLFDYTLCFTDHRIDFNSGTRNKKTTSTHGSVFAYLGPNTDLFAETFAAYGPIVQRYAQ